MTEQQVKEVLGSPKEDISSPDGGALRLFWVVGDKYYSISFDKDKKVIEPLAHGSREDSCPLPRSDRISARMLPNCDPIGVCWLHR
jgi:hypothetical protein